MVPVAILEEISPQLSVVKQKKPTSMDRKIFPGLIGLEVYALVLSCLMVKFGLILIVIVVSHSVP